MHPQHLTFCFERYEFNPNNCELSLFYSYSNNLQLKEVWIIPQPSFTISSELLNAIFFTVHIAAGMSYWKLYAPTSIEVRSGQLTQQQATFWNTVYTNGLGEFFYKNQIDFRDRVQFPYTNVEPQTFSLPTEPHVHTLIPLGGGKDSLTTISCMQQMGVAFETCSLNMYPIIQEQVELLGTPHHVITRTIDPQLLTLNTQDGYNGHVPISVLYGCAALLIAALQGHRYIALSNERSANEGNVSYLGEEINHQWSKGEEFERLFRDYIHTFITPDITYFSLLRPFSELAIAKRFAKEQQWHTHFTSCNKNFSLTNTPQKRWCGSCAKCLFVFTILSPYIPKQKLVSLFEKNLFADAELLPLFEELLGEKRTKPFDCVGTPEETIVALSLAHDVGEYEQDVLMKHFVSHTLTRIPDSEKMKSAVFNTDAHSIPEPFHSFLHSSQHP